MPAPAPPSDGASAAPRFIERGSPAYRRVSAALFLAGFATFSLLYCVQPLLPVFAADFGVSPAESSLALSLSTGSLALAILCAAALSEGLGRRGLMFGSMAAAATLNIAVALVPDWRMLLALRALEGLVLGGVPAVAMAYLAEEIDPRGLGRAMGLYIAGTAFGGMSGRVVIGLLTDAMSWRMALGVLGAAGLVAAIGFILLLPRSRHFTPRPGFDPRHHLADPAMRRLFAFAFLGMGSFVTIYNYAGFRLTEPPLTLGHSEVGLIFTVYLFGIASSSIGGGLADRIGRRVVLPAGVLITASGIALTLLPGLWEMIAGIVVLTIGFFMAHSVASGWVGRLATRTKGHASSLYLLSYYVGSSVVGSAGGWFWAEGGWHWVALFTLALLAVALAASLDLRRLTPPER